MNTMVNINVEINSELFLRDPQKTELGKRLIKHSIELFYDVGYNSFKFKELAIKMDSVEASVYRYFENKHKLQLYLNCWYWSYLNYLIQFNTNNIKDANQKLSIAIETLVYADQQDDPNAYINQKKLHQIVHDQGIIAYHTKKIDEENSKGLFFDLKTLCKSLATIITECKPSYPYPFATASSMLDMILTQTYYAEHLPSLTEVKHKNAKSEVSKFITYTLSRLLA